MLNTKTNQLNHTITSWFTLQILSNTSNENVSYRKKMELIEGEQFDNFSYFVRFVRSLVIDPSMCYQ